MTQQPARSPLPALAGIGTALLVLACAGAGVLLVASIVDAAGQEVHDYGRGVGVALLGLPVAAVLALFGGIRTAGRVRRRILVPGR